MELFRTKVRRVFLQECFACHGGKKVEGEFNLATRKLLLKGGSLGPAVRPGKPNASILIRSVRHQSEPHMPLDKKKLPAATVKLLETWVRYGAPYDRPLGKAKRKIRTSGVVTAKDRQFWSFQQIKAVPLPTTKNKQWSRSALDRFVLARLESAGLSPSPSILQQRTTVIRRVYLGIVGFPPTPRQIADFVGDNSPDAYDRLVDQVLASPGYGERWGRYWLDVARFAESYGFEHDLDNPFAFHYRDFVIRSFNQDLPFRQFAAWQIAGDELAPTEPLARMATGFLAAGVHNADIAKVRVELERYDELDDFANTIGVSLLGLSIGCARCHDHKYDPIPQEDYYRFIACFSKTIRGEVKMRVNSFAKPTSVLVAGEGLTPLKRMYSPGPAFFDPVFQLRRGDPRQKSGAATPGLLTILTPGKDRWSRWAVSAKLPRPAKGTMRRTAVARWLIDTDQGAGNLLARVIVNRVWQHHFGVGIVATPNDFGARGAPPTHPKLLDFLAAELIRHDWQLKPIQRLILRSSTFLQSRRWNRKAAAVDPANRLLWRARVSRLEAESIRDAMLHAAGNLDRRMYGPGTLDESSLRRSVYFRVKRSQMIPMMTLFDQPAALQSIGRRVTTTVAPQALALMNSPHVSLLSQRFATHIAKRSRGDLRGAIELAYLRSLGRLPNRFEQSRAIQFLARQNARYKDHVRVAGKLVSDKSLVLHLDAAKSGDSTNRVWQNQVKDYRSLDARFSQSSNLPKKVTSTPRKHSVLRFNKGNGFYRIKNDPALQFGTGDFSFSLLMRLAPEAKAANIWGKDSYAGKSSYTGYFLQFNRQSLRFATRNWNGKDGPVNYLDSKTKVYAGRWLRVSGVRESGHLRLYLNDGFQPDVEMRERKPTNVNHPTSLKIGEMDDHLGGGFRGDFAEFMIYKRALTAAEIQSNHAYFARRHFLKTSVNAAELALADFCQALFCLNEFVYPR